MRLSKFRVKNYKSIKDSNNCSFEPNITIFAGKNEAGKTSLLEALADFNLSSNIRPDSIPLHTPELTPEIYLTFIIDKNEIEEINKTLGLNLPIPDNTEIEIVKKYPNTYEITRQSIIPDDETAKVKNHKDFPEIHKRIKENLAGFPDTGNQLPDLQTDIDSFKTALNNFRSLVDTGAEVSDPYKKEQILKDLDEMIQRSESPTYIHGLVLEELKKIFPNFIMFTSFDDKFPKEVLLTEIESNELIKDLILISDINLEVIRSGQEHEKLEHQEQLNLKVKSDYKQFWSQDFSNLHFSWNSEKLFFYIKEGEKYYPPDIRSQGKRWHLAFYVRVTARSKESKNNILLIDEPGLFLHAAAQRDILNKLENISETNLVIFSTHSPYLINSDTLNRIRLIHRGSIPKMIEEKDLSSKDSKFSDFYIEKTHKNTSDKYYVLEKDIEKFSEEDMNILKGALLRMGYNIGTITEEKIHKVADKEALTPILTAIGLELTSGIVNLDKQNNVVCEGQSDVFYLNCLKRQLGIHDLNFVFGGGAGNMPMVGTILSGWGCNVLYLYDNDKGKLDAEKKLKKEWLIKDSDIVAVTSIENGSVEDIFDKNDFKKHILEDETVTYSTLNSEYVKSEKKDKVLLARNFLKKYEKDKFKLSEASIRQIKNVFDELTSKFKTNF